MGSAKRPTEVRRPGRGGLGGKRRAAESLVAWNKTHRMAGIVRRASAAWALGGIAIALVASGCGSSSSSDSKTTPTSVAAATTLAHVVSPPRPHLRIVTPRAGARTGQAVNVHLVIRGAAAGGPDAFRYILNGGHPRNVAARFTLTDLAPGRYHLVVTPTHDRAVTASRIFIVHAPPPPPPAPPSQTSAPPAPPTTTVAPAPSTTTVAPAPSRAPTGGIPRNNGGDMDADNNGDPSDGDGNV
ncbi:MAG TPA: hypothetical protein VMU39_03010 [Solirubrobacteraceae bacterium]|nr:hypothetical protein [Solirubrobacteraceae bacterium]